MAAGLRCVCGRGGEGGRGRCCEGFLQQAYEDFVGFGVVYNVLIQGETLGLRPLVMLVLMLGSPVML